MAMQMVVLREGVVISSPGRRFLAMLLDVGLAIVTLGIGWLIWSLFTYKTAQTPAKKIMNMRMIDARTGEALSWGMSFVRDYLVKGFIASLTFGIAYLWILFDPNQQALYDKLMNVIVVDDPLGTTMMPTPPSAPVQSF
jgi:uncharacterized RDD family membrane protein YckC